MCASCRDPGFGAEFCKCLSHLMIDGRSMLKVEEKWVSEYFNVLL